MQILQIIIALSVLAYGMYLTENVGEVLHTLKKKEEEKT